MQRRCRRQARKQHLRKNKTAACNGDAAGRCGNAAEISSAARQKGRAPRNPTDSVDYIITPFADSNPADKI